MNAGATSQRVYHDLKERILAGRYRPGDRLEPAQIGDLLTSSATPVRDSLHVLVGEGLVVTGLSEGFHVPPIDAPALEDLYRWNNEVLSLAARSGAGPLPASAAADYAEATAQLFAAFAARSPNAEHRRAVASLNDRLHAVRVAESTVVPACAAELDGLAETLASGDSRAAQAALARYHRKRIRHAAEIVRARYRPE